MSGHQMSQWPQASQAARLLHLEITGELILLEACRLLCSTPLATDGGKPRPGQRYGLPKSLSMWTMGWNYNQVSYHSVQLISLGGKS